MKRFKTARSGGSVALADPSPHFERAAIGLRREVARITAESGHAERDDRCRSSLSDLGSALEQRFRRGR